MSEPDDLYTLRNHYWLGSYQLAIAEGSGLGRLPEALRVERDEFIYRSYLALGQYSIVLGEVWRACACDYARCFLRLRLLLVWVCAATWNFCSICGRGRAGQRSASLVLSSPLGGVRLSSQPHLSMCCALCSLPTGGCNTLSAQERRAWGSERPAVIRVSHTREMRRVTRKCAAAASSRTLDYQAASDSTYA